MSGIQLAYSAPYVFISSKIRTNSDYSSSDPYDTLAHDNVIDLTGSNPNDGSRDVIFRVTITNTGDTAARVSIADDTAGENYDIVEQSKSFEDIAISANDQEIVDYRARYVGSNTTDGTAVTNTARIKWIDGYYNEIEGTDLGCHGNLTSSTTAYLHNPFVVPDITSQSLSTTTANPGETITFSYQINNPNSFNVDVTLGAQIRPSASSAWIDDWNNDKDVTLPPGTSSHSRQYQIPPNGNVSDPASSGTYDAIWVIFEPGNSANIYDTATDSQGLQIQSRIASLDNGIVRVEVDLDQGGAITEISHQGYNLVDTNDSGRLIQVSLWDDANPNWNPIQAGDLAQHSNPVTDHYADSNSIYTKVRGINWLNTASDPEWLDVDIEQWVTLEDQKVKVRYRVTHFGSDEHVIHHQEFPSVYLRTELSDCITYLGNNPWASAQVEHLGLTPGQSQFIMPIEYWVGFVKSDTFGLTVYSPYHTLLWKAERISAQSDPNYIAVVDQFGLKPGSVHETEVYFIVGNYPDSRQILYELESQNDAPKIHSIDPVTVEPSDFTLRIYGSNFDQDTIDQIFWKSDGHFVGQGPEVLSRSETEIAVTQELTGAPAGTYLVTVKNSAGKLSNFVELILSDETVHDGDVSPWPMFGHDPQHTGQSPYIGPETNNLKWTTDYLGLWDDLSPAIGPDGTIYVFSGYIGKKYLNAINNDGSLKWVRLFCDIA